MQREHQSAPLADTPVPKWREAIDVLFSESQIRERVRDLATEITRDFTGQDVTVVCILRGAFPFFADLVRALEIPVLCEFMTLSSYGDAQTSSGQVTVRGDAGENLRGRAVIIVEDIVDTGLSMSTLLSRLEKFAPRSLSVCTLLNKETARAHNVPIAYAGFEIPDAFVIGYGLDFRGYYRNLPFVGVYRGPT